MSEHPKPYRGCADPWKAEAMKLTKSQLIERFRKACEERDKLRIMLEKMKEGK